MRIKIISAQNTLHYSRIVAIDGLQNMTAVIIKINRTVVLKKTFVIMNVNKHVINNL